MDNKSIKFTASEELDATGQYCFFHILGDDAFPLRPDLMKPYPHRNLDLGQCIFKYRFSRARRVVENAFGILASRFRVFLTTIILEPEKVTTITLCACALHNMLIQHHPLNTRMSNWKTEFSRMMAWHM